MNPEFPSLNLAQCVLLLGYEWRRQTAAVPARGDGTGAAPNLPRGIDVEKLADHFEERLEAAGFFFPKPRPRG